MKKLLFILILFGSFFFAEQSEAALASSTVWEIRSTATANNVNGGGFNASRASAGIDYSQQDTAHLTITDLTINATNTNVTSTLTAFDSNDVGNILHITAGTGFTVGWYEVISVSGVVATLDRACGTADSTSGTARLGGAMSLNSTITDDFFEIMEDGMTIWIKAGTYTLGESIAISNTILDVRNPIVLYGYNTYRGDNPIGDNRPVVACGGSGFGFASGWNFANIIITTTVAGGFDLSSNHTVKNVKSTNTSATADRDGINGSIDIQLIECEAISYNGQGVEITADGVIIGGEFHDSKNGVRLGGSATPYSVMFNIFRSNTESALTITQDLNYQLIANNTFFGGITPIGSGVVFGDTATDVILLNNIFYGFVTGIDYAGTSTTVILNEYNNFYNNTTDSTFPKGTTSMAYDPQFTNVTELASTTARYAGTTLTAGSIDFSSVVDNQDFVYISAGTGLTAGKYLITSHTTHTITTDNDAGESSADNATFSITLGHDFSIGTNLKAQSMPGAFPGGLTTGYLDTGAVQRAEPASEPCTGGGGSGPAILCF